MSRAISRDANKAFTLIELLVVIAIIGILAAILLPTTGGPSRAGVYGCALNLKNLGNNLFAWSEMHDGDLPYRVSVTNGGSMELIPGRSAVAHFKPLTNSGLVLRQSSSVLTNINGRDVNVSRWTTNYGLMKNFLVCPSDQRRRSIYLVQSVSEITDANISYFANLSAGVQNTNLILAGDRHLRVNGGRVEPGLLVLSPKMSLSWSKELHGSFEKGNLLFADGHVEFVKKPTSVLIPKSAPSTQLVIP